MAYKVYSAQLTKSGNVITANVLDNSIGEITWSRQSEGYFIASLDGAFPENKTLIFIGNPAGGERFFAAGLEEAPNTLYIIVYTSDGTLNDGEFVLLPFEIRVYS